MAVQRLARVVALMTALWMAAGCGAPRTRGEVPTPPVPDKPEVSLETTRDKISYGMGLEAGRRLLARKIDHDVDAFAAGAEDQLAGKDLAFTQDEIRAIREEFNEHYWANRDAREQRIRDRNLEDAQAYFRALLEQPGVRVTDGGAVYEVLQKGAGERPESENRVRLAFRAFRLNGLEFDSSARREGPEVIAMTETLEGMRQVLPLMREGAVYRLHLPPYLAYDEVEHTAVSPGEAVVFELELLEVLPPAPEEVEDAADGPADGAAGESVTEERPDGPGEMEDPEATEAVTPEVGESE